VETCSGIMYMPPFAKILKSFRKALDFAFCRNRGDDVLAVDVLEAPSGLAKIEVNSGLLDDKEVKVTSGLTDMAE